MKAIGIDLGTTNSVAAWCASDGRDPKVLSNSLGENLTPSVVSFRKARREGEPGEILVGREALNYGPRAPEDTILSIKRLMGRDTNDPQVAEVQKKFNYRVVPGPQQDPRAHVLFGGKTCAPAEISALILRKIKEDAGRALGEEVTHAVITVPAYFEEGQRAATREAGEKAGLMVKKIIDEPTAAAIAFGLDARAGDRHRILVYDLGGGTFDISILQMVKDTQGHSQFQVLQIEGDSWLGGDDFDRHVVERIVAAAREEAGEDPAGDRRFLFLAKRAAEEAKRALGHAQRTEVVIPAAFRTSKGLMIDVELALDRTELEEMIRAEVAKSVGLVQKALGAQNLGPEDVTDVLLVGGSTLTPAVYQAVENYFGAGKVRRHLNPMECVALGASILAATLRGVECPNPTCGEVNDEAAGRCAKCGHELASGRAVGETTVGEVTAMSLGIAAVKGNQIDVFVPIIPKGTPYPLREPMKQRFKATNERLIRVPVYEGDESVASRNAEQGLIELDLPKDIDPGAEVEVSFNYDRNRQLTVTLGVPGTDLYKTEMLRRDRPRAARREAPKEEGTQEAWQDALADTIEFAKRFLDHYQTYMETSQSVKLSRDIERAKQVLGFNDETEGQRMHRLLLADVFNCDLATQLYLADGAVNGAPPEEARQISDAARIVRQHHERGEREQTAEKARILKVLVAKNLERRTGVKEIADQENYEGLLRLLGG